MHSIRIRRCALPLVLAGLLPLAAHAAATQEDEGSISREISADMADARKEVRAELAAARKELETGNLDIRDSLHFGRNGKRAPSDPALPKAEITPHGDFLLDGEEVAIDAGQRRELLAYRGQVIEVARAGIDIGEQAALIALDTVDRGLFSLMVSAMTGSLERRVEKTVKESLEPGVTRICRSLPSLLESQQRLAASLPEFRPYATLQADDVDDCEDEIRREFAQI
jgi:hypothetical protein